MKGFFWQMVFLPPRFLDYVQNSENFGNPWGVGTWFQLGNDIDCCDESIHPESHVALMKATEERPTQYFSLSSPVVNNDLHIISRLWGDLVDDEENEECSIQSDQHVSDRLEGFQVDGHEAFSAGRFYKHLEPSRNWNSNGVLQDVNQQVQVANAKVDEIQQKNSGARIKLERVLWHCEGDKNTAFFHQLTKVRCATQNMNIGKKDGILIQYQAKLEEVVASFYR
ncbi:hypothetical protein JHK82_024627 [Glycine max]|nr:hypothetical protein JHK85_025232 [Glycine max]KAG5012471.1 hypothetical protein JHK86_024732 [Glycine max]KAG5133439.1 hypothetical protein JHK82_024627 [Glycine max]